MIALADDALKASVIVSAGLLIAWTLRHRSAAVRHWVLASAIIGALVVPVLERLGPSWHLPIMNIASPQVSPAPPPTDQAAGAAEAVADIETAPSLGALPQDGGRGFDTGTAIGTIWIAGTVVSLGLLLIGLARLWWLASRARVLTTGTWSSAAFEVTNGGRTARRLVLLQSDHPTLLVTWGITRPKVILPRQAADWDAARVRLVLRHELAHVRRSDWMAQMLAELLRALYWFNPLIWIACRRLREESELACDAMVMNEGVNGSEYASELLELARMLNARRDTWFAAPAMARRSSLERRVAAMLTIGLNRTPVRRLTRLGIGAAIAVVAVAVAGFQASAQSFASLSGSVVDQFGGAVPGVALRLASTERDQKYEVHSNELGTYQFVGLPAGDYELEAAATGFNSTKHKVTIAGQNARRDVALEIGTLQETISVVAQSGPRTETLDRIVPKVAAAGPAPTGSNPAASCVSSSTGGRIKPPTKIADMRPRYPEALRDMSTGGVVLLDALIGPDGTVREVTPVDPAVNPDLADAAMEAVWQWRYTPTLLNCVPIDVRMKVTVSFRTE